MGYKVFISYKYSDSHVRRLNGEIFTTARNYVDEIQRLLSIEDHLNKGEVDDESLADFVDSTIEGKLKGKIFDSSITIVLISKNMWDKNKVEKDQWIPWEISYSLRNKTRNTRISYTNGLLAIVLPDENNSYDYFIANHYCDSCDTILYRTDNLFKVLRENMFNKKNKNIKRCEQGDHEIQYGEFSYAKTVKWDNFISNINKCLVDATKLREERDNYYIAINVY
jgi:hypothetical protein